MDDKPNMAPEKVLRLNQLLGQLSSFYKDDVKKVVQLCYELGATYEQVADALKTTRQNIHKQYPKEKKETENVI